MSSLEVLQSCPLQQKALLSAIDGLDHIDENLIYFDLKNHVPQFPSHLTIHILVIAHEKTIFRTIVDKGNQRVLCQGVVGRPLTLLRLCSPQTH